MTARLTSTPEEVAARYGVSAKTIYRHLQSGKLPGSKIGTRWLILDEEARAWFDAQRPTAAPVDTGVLRMSGGRTTRPRRSEGGSLRSFVATQGGRA